MPHINNKKSNGLLNAVVKHFSRFPRGKVLDLGCGQGDYAQQLREQGFDVMAGDIDGSRFRYHGQIEFCRCDITKELPFADDSFDYVVLMEVVEHLRNPYFVLPSINRILKPGGVLVLSTPNILNLKSRFRFLIEGAYDYFREPPLDQASNPKDIIFNLHVNPYRYHELEFLLRESHYTVEKVFGSIYEGYHYAFILPFIRLQALLKERRSLKRGGLDYRRIHRIILSKDILFSRHLIVEAKKIHGR